MNRPEYSVVIPLMNEEENIQDLIEELRPIMKGLQKPWELICIDDGSTDQTLQVLQKLRTQMPELRVISFERNFGQTSAFDAGFRSALGQYVITLDGDRQNDPRDIPKLVALAASHDLIVGWRKQRQDSLIKKMTSTIANFVRGRVCKDHMHDTGCSLKLYRKSALDAIQLFHGMHRFLPALFLMKGFRVTEIPVNHRKRAKGKTKYNFFNRSFNTVADMLAVRWMGSRLLQYKVKQEW
jgi:dolichol-phosphate mannosyltransferase